MVLNRLRGDPKAKIKLLTALRKLYDGVEDFDVHVEAGSVQVFLQEGNVTMPATRLSDGTLRYLCLLAILCHPSPPKLICIEEPELGLHPDILPGPGRPPSRSLRTVPAHRHHALGHARRRADGHAGEHRDLREGERTDEAQAPGQGGALPLAREVPARGALDLRGARRKPLVKVKVYVEGGGDGKDLRTKCRRGFSSFFEKADLVGRMPQVIACGGRAKAIDKFCIALRARKDQEFILLLVDSEDPVAPGAGPWQHLERRDRWEKPDDAADEHAHLMVQCMEALVPGRLGRPRRLLRSGIQSQCSPRTPGIRRGSQGRLVRRAEKRHPAMQEGRVRKGATLLRHLGANRP